MGVLGIIWKIVAVTFLAILGLAAYLYFSDYEASATVTERSSDSGGNFVIIKPNNRLITYEHKAYFEDDQAYRFVCQGYQVKIALKSLHYQVFDGKATATSELGTKVYDSLSGLQVQQTQQLIACGTSNSGVLRG